MAKRSEYVDYLLEQLAPLGGVRAKAMFGGYGVYCEELFFAIVIDEVLHFKVDDHTRPAYLAQGLTPFVFYTKAGKTTQLSYYPLPDAVLESQPALLRWAREALAVSLRAYKPKPLKRARVKTHPDEPSPSGY